MPKCPECEAEIDHLLNYCDKTVVFIMEINKNGYAEYIKDEELEGYTEGEYCCPICKEQLFTNEKDAIAFLKSKTHSNNGEEETKCDQEN